MSLRDDSALLSSEGPLQATKWHGEGPTQIRPPSSDLKGEQLSAPATTFLKTL
jgi:hypothetical protein